MFIHIRLIYKHNIWINIYELVSNWPHLTSTVVFIIKWFFQIRTWGCSGAHFTLIKSIILETSWCDQKQNFIIETCGTPFSPIQCFWASMVKSNEHKWHNNYLEQENTGWFNEYVVYLQCSSIFIYFWKGIVLSFLIKIWRLIDCIFYKAYSIWNFINVYSISICSRGFLLVY